MIWTDELQFFGLCESDERLRPNYSIVMAKLEGPLAQHIQSLSNRIPDHHLVGVGREPLNHITVLYGLHDHHPKGAQNVLAGHAPPKARFGRVSAFTANPKFDVVKVDVHSPDFEKMHHSLKSLPNTQKFDYKPHTTVAYVRKGMGNHYANELNKVSRLDGYEHTFNTLHFSEPRARTMHQISFKQEPRSRFAPEPARPMPGRPRVEDVISMILAGAPVDETLTTAMVGTQPVSGFGFVRPIFPVRRRHARAKQPA